MSTQTLRTPLEPPHVAALLICGRDKETLCES